jgi:hypothetical protein
MYGYIELPAVQNGTNCRSCRMTRSDCEFADEGEADVRCCDYCNHPRGATGGENAVAASAMHPDWASDQARDESAVRGDRDVRTVRETGDPVASVSGRRRASVLRGEGATPAPVPVEDAPSASGVRTFGDDEEPPFGERITMRNAEGTEIVWNGKRWFEQGYERSLSMHEAWPPANQNYAGPWFEVGEGQQ